jgi:hypothetical protein
METPYHKKCEYEFCENPEFIAKRSNQKFCCKDHYVKQNNYLAKTKRDLTKNINAILAKNREILIQNFEKNNGIISEEKLLSAGYNFTYHTHKLIIKDSSDWVLFCYDFGIYQRKDKLFKIEKS